MVVPATAATWSLVKLVRDAQNKSRREACQGEPLEDGRVPEQWAAADFSERNVVEWWGPGKYRVDFQDGKGEHVEGGGRIFTVAIPAKPGKLGRKPKRGAPSASDDEPAEARGGGSAPSMARRGLPELGAGGTLTMMDFWAMQREEQRDAREREDRARERSREEAREARESDRQLMLGMMQMMAQGRATAAPDFSPDLLRRELALEMREGIAGIRRDLATDLGSRPPPDDDDPDDAPANLEDGASRIAMRMLGELEQRAPELLQEAIPTIVGWIRSKGVPLSPALQKSIEEHRAGQNGGRTPHA